MERTRELALAYLSRADRTVSQVRDRLARKGCRVEAVDQVIDALKQERLLDDMAFAHRWIEYGLERRPAGAPKFRQDLHRKGVDREIVETALAGFADQVGSKEVALRLLRGLAGRYTGLEQRVAKRRMFELLARRGFEESTTMEAVDEILAELEEFAPAAAPRTGERE